MSDPGDALLNRLMFEIAVDLEELSKPVPAFYRLHTRRQEPPYSGVERRKPAGSSIEKRSRSGHEVPIEHIRTAAYYLWRARQGSPGDAQTDWYAAERQCREKIWGVLAK